MTSEPESAGMDLDKLRRQLPHVDMPAEMFAALLALLERVETLSAERSELRAKALNEGVVELRAYAKQRERTAEVLAQLGKGSWEDYFRAQTIEDCAERVAALEPHPEPSDE